MTLRFRHFAIFWVLLASFNSWSQTPEPQQIDQFGKINSEETEARLESAVTKLRNNPGTFLEFVIHRDESDPPGLVYRTFGIQKAFMLARKLDPKRIISTFCDAQPLAETQLWLINSLNQRHTCIPEEIKLDSSVLFISSPTPNPLYEFGTCCLVDNLGTLGSMEALRAYASVIKSHPLVTAYVVVYGGTNLYLTSDSRDRDQKVRHLDSASFVTKLRNDIRKRLISSGVKLPQIVIINGGYRDAYSSIDLWIIPPGGKRPASTPNYFPRSRRPIESKR